MGLTLIFVLKIETCLIITRPVLLKIKHKCHFVYFQIIVGKIKKQMCAITRTKFEPKEGELCLTDVEKYIYEWPQLAEILNVDKENAQAEVQGHGNLAL